MVSVTHCDSPAFWQTYLSDPASISMEGILISLSFKEIQLLPEILLGIPLIALYVLNMESNSPFNTKATSAFRKVRPLLRYAVLYIPEDFANYQAESSNLNTLFSDTAAVGKIVTIDPVSYFTPSILYIVAPIFPTNAKN